MRKLILTLSLLITASSYAASGYTFYYMSECSSGIEEKYGEYCAAIITDVFYMNDCSPSQYDGCSQQDLKDEYGDGLFIDTPSASYPESSKSEAKRERRKRINKWKNSSFKDYYIKQVNWN
ncbi:hypothetical protein A9Q84_17595 [Halobacteriovorax marinus]|uniref:Lipoprotein n=1 Tax=Halobacteriovorax marinus TaxID=97084 RepID=A0A1Y5F375_9BACT|nr:hypothetical protein A9Q84_17595 [Halobacteriovorax marinus]